MFSFVLLDTKDKSFIAARDAIGITPLYLGWGHDGILYIFLFLLLVAFYIFILDPVCVNNLLFN